METPVIFKSQGRQVVGMLHVPGRRKGRIPAVVFFHGFTGTKVESHRIFVKMARALAGVGIAALRFDFRGSGDSEGDFSSMTLTGKLKDARAAFRFIRALPRIDKSRIGVLGLSFGGAVASLLLGEDPGIVTAVLWSPVIRPDEMIRRNTTRETIQQLKELGCVDYGGNAVGKAFLDDAPKYRPIEAITKTGASVLLVHGDADEKVPVKSSHECEAALKKAGRTVVKHIVPGADHTYKSLAWETQVIELTLEWFRCNFDSRADDARRKVSGKGGG
jgi:uncharacterized protein